MSHQHQVYCFLALCQQEIMVPACKFQGLLLPAGQPGSKEGDFPDSGTSALGPPLAAKMTSLISNESRLASVLLVGCSPSVLLSNASLALSAGTWHGALYYTILVSYWRVRITSYSSSPSDLSPTTAAWFNQLLSMCSLAHKAGILPSHLWHTVSDSQKKITQKKGATPYPLSHRRSLSDTPPTL